MLAMDHEMAEWSEGKEVPPRKKRPRAPSMLGRSRPKAYPSTVLARNALKADSPLNRPVSFF